MLNLGSIDSTSNIEIRGVDGALEISHLGAQLPPMDTHSVGTAGPDPEVFCKVEVPGVAKSKLRLVLCLTDVFFTPIACVTGS